MIIKDIFNKECDCKCVGCSIGNGEMIPPGGILISTNNFVLHQDQEIPIKAFLIIASKEHIKSLSAVRDILSYARNHHKTEENIADILLTLNIIKSILKYENVKKVRAYFESN